MYSAKGSLSMCNQCNLSAHAFRLSAGHCFKITLRSRQFLDVFIDYSDNRSPRKTRPISPKQSFKVLLFKVIWKRLEAGQCIFSMLSPSDLSPIFILYSAHSAPLFSELASSKGKSERPFVLFPCWSVFPLPPFPFRAWNVAGRGVCWHGYC